MARKQTLDAVLALYKKLGGNLNEVMGTKTNVNFLGKGKSPELMLDMDINAEALGVLPRSKAVDELKSSVGYAVSGKLNDIQASQLLKNMQTMDSVYFPPAVPANITDLQTGIRNLDQEGLMSLRAEEKLADDLVKNVSEAEFNLRSNFPKASDKDIKDMLRLNIDNIDDLPPPGSRGGPDDIAAPFTGAGLEAIKNVKNNNLIVNDIVDKIYLNIGVSANAQPVARANAREFLNRVKDLEDPQFKGGTTLSSIMEADDFKFMTEGGGGGMGDPMLLVQKYFGPKVASSVAQLDNADDIQKFAENLVKIKDAKGNSITSRYFDPESISPDDFEFADGGLARPGYRSGKSVIGIMDVAKNFLNKKSNVVLNETLTQNETKYLKELIEDTGGGQFTSDIMEEVPSLKIIGNKISVDKQDINSLSKFLDDMYISDLAPSGRGVDKMPPRLRDTTNNILTKLLRSEKADGGLARPGYMAGNIVRGLYTAAQKSAIFKHLGGERGSNKNFKNLYKFFKNPDSDPALKDKIDDLLREKGLFRGGGLAKILEV